MIIAGKFLRFGGWGDCMTAGQTGKAARERGVDALGLFVRFLPATYLFLVDARFAIVEPNFLSPMNLFNVTRQASIVGLLAIGMTFVIITAGIDISVGSLVAFAGLVGAAVAKGGSGDGWAVAATAAIAVGLRAVFSRASRSSC
jgi:inositol transport system permease protein